MRFPQFRLALIVAVVAAAAAVTGPSQAATLKLRGTVGPGFTIQLKQGLKNVTKLRPGTYLLVVSDKSQIHDFRIGGPGLNKVVTGVSFVGTKTTKVRLKRGTYNYVCDPHRTLMHGRFKVG
ncbi:MAG: hypothetical protein H0W90_14930 [Actinobacteria bacterium]|nr:hypothetical protein [Actinomycetota bacterium]